MNIVRAIQDQHLFRPFIASADGELRTWKKWMTAMRVVYGLPVNPMNMNGIKKFTGRTVLPKDGFDTALFLTGRRSGKSRMAAVIAAYEATIARRDKKLAKGEHGIVATLAPTRRQAAIVRDYIRAVFETRLLKEMIIRETGDGFELTNKIRIEVMAGDWRTVRGFTLVAAIVDEAAFFGFSEESKVKSDKELIRALQPGLATTRGKLIVISTPYARRGWCFEQHRRNFGNEKGNVLVWNCGSQDMNPTLPKSVIDEAMEEDRSAALSEYYGQFRDDVAQFLPLAVIENAVVKDRKELMPHTARHSYEAFADLSGGRHDDAALAIGHKKEGLSVVDAQRLYKAPFSPQEIVAYMADELKRFSIRTVTGDNYSGDFVAQEFRKHGIQYLKAKKPKSELYLEFLGRLCSGQVELLDDNTATKQFSLLERRTRSGGKDIIDHAAKCKDDLANVIAGLTATNFEQKRQAGVIGRKRKGLV